MLKLLKSNSRKRIHSKKKIQPKPKRRKISTIVPDVADLHSTQIINLIGYILLALTLVEYIVFFVPPKFLNPVWEFQTIGKIVDLAWAPLLGLMLIFYRHGKDHIKLGELRILSIISWLTLFLATVYFLSAPLLISNTLRLNRRNITQANQQISLQMDRVQKFEQQLNQKNEQQLQQLIHDYSQKNNRFANSSPQIFKQQILNELKTKEQSSRQQIEQALKSKHKSLIQSAFKWIIGALLTGFSLVFIWNSTKWVRNLKENVKPVN